MGVPGLRRERLAAALLVPLLAVLLGGCDRSPGPTEGAGEPADSVVVASFNFPESELLAEIYSQALEQAGVPVRREPDLGPRELVEPALRQGLVDVVPEYLGTALATVAPASVRPGASAAAVLGELRAALRPLRLTALQPAAATDQNGFAVTRRTADALGLHTLSDLAAHAPSMTLGGPAECPVRPYCLPGLQRVYGIHVARFETFDEQTQRATALREGVVDVAVTFTTDGVLATGDPVLLADDRHLQPVEQIVPVVSDRSIARYGPQLTRTLDAVSRALDTDGLRFLNWRVTVAGKPVPAEARGWLLRHGLLPP